MNFLIYMENIKNEPKRIENLNELYKFFKEGDYEELNGEDSLRRLLTITSLSNSEIDRSISMRKIKYQ